ncbi:DUF4397 domain-containing protein [Agarivorans sp. MS3-6]|uniref:DUF4397 domain-containing protein n=1 Tax=Agarivorans sp. TSD2052 TaxID=2937286 RepID=UPI00200EAB9F|nr:DUF4397 domain-containing protein [Agarivorans sp. TSD2052]UPW18230.1 DUF4397 domain-containing protein [Agarivorans sp. TSD2052]
MSKLWKLAVLVLVSITLVACDLSNFQIGDDDEDESATSSTGYFRFVNLVPASPDIELIMDENAFAQIGFAESSALTELSTGSYDLEFNQILPNTEYARFTDDDEITIKKQYIHSYILYGEDPFSPEVLTIQTDVDDLYDDEYDDGQARIQFFQASSELANVDIYLVDEGGNLLNKSVTSSLSYMGESEELDVDQGTYKIIVTESDTSSIVIAADNISLEAASSYIYSVVSYSVAGSNTLRYAVVECDEDEARLITNDAQPAYLRVNNAIANTEAIDIYFDDGSGKQLLFTHLDFGDLSAEAEITISDVDDGDSMTFYMYDFGADIDTDSALAVESFEITTDSQITIIAAGDSDEDLTLNDQVNDLSIIATHGKLIFTHAIDNEDSESLDIVVVADGANPSNYEAVVTLTYLGSEEYQIEQGDYDIYIYGESSGDLLLEYSLSNVEEGDVVNLTATESAYGGAPYDMQRVFY